MTEAYAIKGPDGSLNILSIARTEKGAWAKATLGSEGLENDAKRRGGTCVPVAVSEKGEADDVPVKDVGDYYAIQFGNGIYLQRKAIKTATEQPLSDTDNVIIKLCAYLSRGQG